MKVQCSVEADDKWESDKFTQSEKWNNQDAWSNIQSGGGDVQE